MSLPVTLTVRGTLAPSTLEDARVLHNETAGSAPGIAAARSLGDLSHIVFAPCLASKTSGAVAGELLFLDVWQDAGGIQQFFSNPEVGAQAQRMFKTRDATVWMRATGAYTYNLPPPRAGDKCYLGVIRGPVASPEKAIEIFAAADAKGVRNARRRSLISHDIFIKLGPPGEPLELLGLDLWSDFDGMTEHYSDASHIQAIVPAFSGKPAASVWERAPGAWNEW